MNKLFSGGQGRKQHDIYWNTTLELPVRHPRIIEIGDVGLLKIMKYIFIHIAATKTSVT